ncbi:hypothetical protein A4X09_0g6415 [Tilletia walkeri]|uniref:Uncharacterized protein n=1 Tax=Tilletia walkeri TaxID=117179 RepID=A0A8X7N2U0_9BASI|nr:hypothetical protein A4X09_0g6415 [Tilletia walkeri]
MIRRIRRECGRSSHATSASTKASRAGVCTAPVRIPVEVSPVQVQGLLHRWIEGDLAKDVFELNVWSSSIVSIDVDYLEEYLQTGRGAVGVSVTTQVTLRNVIFHEDVGYGGKDNSRSHWSGTVVTQPSEASSTSRSRSGARLKIILLGPNGASRVKKDQAVRQMKGSPGELMFELRTADQTSAATSYKPA